MATVRENVYFLSPSPLAGFFNGVTELKCEIFQIGN